MDRPFFSIVVLVYKVEAFLRQCLDSILNQTFEDFEAILVDDGSPDGCGIICDEYGAKDPRFVVLHQENGGIAKARKAAAAVVRGKYMGAVDGDDWVEPDYLAQAYDKLQDTHADILQFDTFFNMPREIRVGTFRLPEGFYDGSSFEQKIIGPYRKRNMAKHSIISSSLCVKLIRSSLLIPEILALSEDFIFGEDAVCVFLCLAKAKSFYYLKKTLYHYRRRPQSSTHRYDPSGIERSIRLRQHLGQRLEAMGRENLHHFSEVVYLRLLILHLFMTYAYSGSDIRKWRQIRRALILKDTRQAIGSVTVFSTNLKLSAIIFMIKMALPPPYFLVKPNLPTEGLFLHR